MPIKKIVVIGPESTGKSALCRALADHYHTIWVKEYAREYLLENGTDYSYETLNAIATGQIKLEEEALQQLKNQMGEETIPLFIDTDMYVMKVWSEYVFNDCNNKILDIIASRNYDLYLLANIDLPWVKDELREYPDLATREKLFHHYKDILVQQHVPWAIISGVGEERLKNAVAAVDKII